MSILNDNLIETLCPLMTHVDCKVIQYAHGDPSTIEKHIQTLLQLVKIDDFNASMVKRCIQMVCCDSRQKGAHYTDPYYTDPYQAMHVELAEAEYIIYQDIPDCIEFRVFDRYNSIIARISPIPVIDEGFIKGHKNSATLIDGITNGDILF